MARGRKRKNGYAPGWYPPDAIAWCRLHERGMNQAYIRKKGCLTKSRQPYCKHFQWLGTAGPEESGTGGDA